MSTPAANSTGMLHLCFWAGCAIPASIIQLQPIHKSERLNRMYLRAAIMVAANFALIACLIVYGLRLFAEYHSRGKWAKNGTSLLAGLGLLTLACAQLLSPRSAEVLLVLSQSRLPGLLLWMSDTLLIAAIVAFGVITYLRPLRLWHERKIERDLSRELPNVS